MHPESFSPQPRGEAAPSLEELLALQPTGSAQAPLHSYSHPASQAFVASPQASPTSTQKAEVLFVLTSTSADELLLAWAQGVLGGHQPHAARAEDVLSQVQVLQPQAVLIEFDHHNLDTATTLATQLQAFYPDVTRVAVGHAQHPDCMLAALRAGVHDFLDMDGPVSTSQEILHRLLQRERPSVAPPVHHPAPQLAIISARAGLGCSVLASHLAWYLQQSVAGTVQEAADEQALACLLIEPGGAEISGGDCAIYLNAPGEFGLADAVAQQHRLDRRMTQTALTRHDSGLRLLPQPRAASPLAQGEALALMTRLSQYFSHIVIDLGAHTPPALQAELLANASDIWVVCDQNVVSVVWTMALLSHLETLQIDRDRLRLIVNRHDNRLALDAQQIASRLQIPLLATLPERRRELADAVNHGKLLSPRQKSEPYVQAVDKLVALLLQKHHPDARPHQPPPGALTQLLQRIRRS